MYCNELPDGTALYEAYELQEYRRTLRLPRCAECDEPIDDDCCWEVNDEPVCDLCMRRNHRRCVDSWMT